MSTLRCISTGSIVVLFVLAILAANPIVVDVQAQQQVKTVYAIGSSPIRGDDTAASRDQAIADSLAGAVGRVLTDVVARETVEGSFQAISETILDRSDLFVRDYKVLKESTHGNTYRVLVQVTVAANRLSSALKQAGIRQGRKSLPRVLFFVAEKKAGDSDYSYWWGGRAAPYSEFAGRALARKAVEAGLRVVEPPSEAVASSAYSAELSISEAITIGRQTGADVVVIGKASAQAASDAMAGSLQTFRASVDIAAYRTDSGEQIAQIRQNALATAPDLSTGNQQVLQNAAASAGEQVAQQIVAASRDAESGGTRVALTVEGTGGQIANYVKFRGALSSVSGVQTVQQKEMMANSVAMEILHQGSARALADAILLLDFDTFDVHINDVGLNTITLQLVPKQ